MGKSWLIFAQRERMLATPEALRGGHGVMLCYHDRREVWRRHGRLINITFIKEQR
jgi:hypothetical protein